MYSQYSQQQSSSQAPNNGSAATASSTSALAAHVAEKKKELENFQNLAQLSSNLVQQLNDLSEKTDTLTSGTEAVAAVLQNWGNIIRAVTLANTKITSLAQEDYEDIENPPLPEILVRKRLD